MKTQIIVVALLVFVLVSGCNSFDGLRRPIAEGQPSNVGRFQMLQFERTLANGTKNSAVLRIDTATGETWILELQGDSAKWASVSDNLNNVIEYERGPDGKLRPTKKSNGGAPKVGAVEDGYIFLGGDPANKTSWKKQ